MHEAYYLHIFVTLLLVASAVAVAVKWIRVPYSIALVIVGLIIGLLHLLPAIELDPDVMLLVFLPGLLFEASWNLNLKQLRFDWLPISLLATVGVAISMGIVAVLMSRFAGFSPVPAFLFGAILAATDPISVISLFKKMGVDKRLNVLIEGESLFNDGTAVVLFRIILTGALSGVMATPLALGANLVIVTAGGMLVGLILGWGASKITRLFDDHLLEITLTTILAYGSYLVAEQLAVSPVLAVIVAGIVMGNYGSRTSMTPSTRLAVNSFWEYVAFAINSFVFLLIGLQVKYELLVKYSTQIGVGILAILLARVIIVYCLCNLAGLRRRWKIPFVWQHVLFWGGVRGALSMAMALSLPATIAGRESIVITTFGVVLFTLLVPGLTVEPLIKILKIRSNDFTLDQYRALRGELMSINAAGEHLDSLRKSGQVSDRTYEILKSDLAGEALVLSRQIDDLHLSNTALQQIELSETGLELLHLRKDRMALYVREGRIGEESAQAVRAKLDAKMLYLTEQEAQAVKVECTAQPQPQSIDESVESQA